MCVGGGLMVCLKLYFTTRFVNTVAFHPDGNCIAVGTTDNVIKVLVASTCNSGYRMYLLMGSKIEHSRFNILNYSC